MDGKYWARKSEIDGSKLVYANTDNFPDSLFIIEMEKVLFPRIWARTFLDCDMTQYKRTSPYIKLFPIQSQIQNGDRFDFFFDHDVIGLGASLYGIRSLQVTDIVSPINFTQEPYFYFASINGFLTWWDLVVCISIFQN